MKKVVVIIMSLLLGIALFSNGGPIDWSQTLKSGNYIFTKNEDVHLEKEEIYIEVDGDFSHVSVNYVLVNNGSDKSMTYGFPVDISTRDSSINRTLLGKEVPEFNVFLNDRIVEYSIDTDSKKIKYDYPNVYTRAGTSEESGVRVLYYFDLPIKEGETCSLSINYTIQSHYYDYGTTKSFIPGYSDRMFIYDLALSKYWGNGMVDDFLYRIDFSKLHDEYGSVTLEPEHGEWESADIFSYTTENYDLYRDETITFKYSRDAYLKTKFFEENRLDFDNITSVKASSTLQAGKRFDYNVHNLLDNNFTTVWVEGSEGDGLGEYVEIEFDDAYIYYIGIVNGFNYSESLYESNGRVLSIEYELLIDEDESHFSYGADFYKRTETIKDSGYSEINPSNYAPYTQEIVGVGEFGLPVKKVRLIIDEAKSGSRYSDICISEIIILGEDYEDYR